MDLKCFQILEYLHKHNEISWRWDANLSMKFIHLSYASYMHKLNVIYAVFLGCLCIDSNSLYEVIRGIFHLWYDVNAQDTSDVGALGILNIQIWATQLLIPTVRMNPLMKQQECGWWWSSAVGG